MDHNIKFLITRIELDTIKSRLLEASEKGYIVVSDEQNQHLLYSFKGVEEYGISPKWSVKIYTYNQKKKGHSVVCVDRLVFDRLIKMDFKYFSPPNLKILKIDDAGWGFPLCGVMVGITNGERLRTGVVPVEYFRHDSKYPFISKQYLKVYADIGVKLVNEFGAYPKTHRIEICSGYINRPLRENLREIGFDVRVVENKGRLQAELENKFDQYVLKSVGKKIYYDPKDISNSEIPKKYHECLAFGQKNCPELIKTGWDSVKGVG